MYLHILFIWSPSSQCWFPWPLEKIRVWFFYNGDTLWFIKINKQISNKILNKVLFFTGWGTKYVKTVFSHTAGAWTRGVVFLVTCSVLVNYFFLSAIADENFRAPVPTKPFVWVWKHTFCWLDVPYSEDCQHGVLLRPTLRIMLGWIGLRNQRVSWRQSAWQWLQEVCENKY